MCCTEESLKGLGLIDFWGRLRKTTMEGYPEFDEVEV
jgi:hypothetical protein